MSTTRTKEETELLLRGLAITAVVGVHFLAGLPAQVYTTSSWQGVTVLLDQLSRISVPLFVALSGFGLSFKYANQSFNWREYLSRRVLRLLPLYILWSVIFYLVFWLIPTWRPSNTPPSFLTQLIWGRADYQLYFVPMIFQLYLLFPFIQRLMKKYPLILLAGSFVFQVVLYAFYSEVAAPSSPPAFFKSDQQQYVWCISWIFYFVLGMYVAEYKKKLRLPKLLAGLALIMAGAALAWAVMVGVGQIDAGLDPIVALRFTRWPILVYASGTVFFLLLYPRVLLWLPNVLRKGLRFVGRHSYSIYLSHTLFLRAFFALLAG